MLRKDSDLVCYILTVGLFAFVINYCRKYISFLWLNICLLPMDCSLPGSSVHGIFQAMVLEWIAISLSRGCSWPRDQTRVSRTVDSRFTVWATREVLFVYKLELNNFTFLSTVPNCPVICFSHLQINLEFFSHKKKVPHNFTWHFYPNICLISRKLAAWST